MRVHSLVLIIAPIALAPAAGAQSLRGSAASVERQREVSIEHDFTFLRTANDVRRFAGLGLLVPVTGGRHYQLRGVSFAYARPQVRTFVERLSAQYEAACKETLVVTSLTRPLSSQPRNASAESVHPAGMAVDIRLSNAPACRRWLERTLLSLEAQRVVEATRERRPAHYHVAVFPTAYESYVARLSSGGFERAAASSADAATATSPEAESGPSAAEAATVDYVVSAGESWWTIARQLGSSVDELKSLNGVTSDRLFAGQRILVPSAK